MKNFTIWSLIKISCTPSTNLSNCTIKNWISNEKNWLDILCKCNDCWTSNACNAVKIKKLIENWKNIFNVNFYSFWSVIELNCGWIVIMSLLRLGNVADNWIIPRAIWRESRARPKTLLALVNTQRLLIRTPPPKWNVVPQPLNDAWNGTWPSAAFLPPTILSPLSAEKIK